MNTTFERGSEQGPKGHALLYFTASMNPDEIWATYVVILPITVDVAKYVPPFLMNQMGDLGPKDLSAFAFPPAPEKLESRAQMEAIASMRGDDILYCGSLNPNDVTSSMMRINEAVQWYADRYSQAAEAQTPHEASAADSGYNVNEVLYGLMSDGDKLSELTKLVGRLRYAAEGGETSLVKDAEGDIALMAKHLPEDHQIERLVEAAKSGGGRGAKLTELYLQRCFHLVHQEYLKLSAIEGEIRALESGEAKA